MYQLKSIISACKIPISYLNRTYAKTASYRRDVAYYYNSALSLARVTRGPPSLFLEIL